MAKPEYQVICKNVFKKGTANTSDLRISLTNAVINLINQCEKSKNVTL